MSASGRLPRAIIFDLDDTLVPESQYVASGFRAVAEHVAGVHGIAPSSVAAVLERAKRSHPGRVFDELLVQLGIGVHKTTVSELIHVYRDHRPTLEFYPDVAPTIHDLRSAGFRLGIVTDGHKLAQRRKLQAVKAESIFDHVIITDELGREFWKPHPYAFQMTARRFGLDIAELVYVGDNPAKDFLIGETERVVTVRIVREGGVHAERPYLRGVREHRRIESLRELVSLTSTLRV